MSATRRQTRRPRAGRPPRFERDELIAAALEVGPEHLALRDVSVVLGAPPTTIYNHVRSSDELGRLVLASLLATEPATPWPLGDEHPWPTLLADFAVRTRAALFAAGSWLKYWTPGIAAAPVRRADRLIARLVGDGFTVEAAGHALALVHAVVQDSVSYHAYVAGNARADGVATLLDSLDAAEFPWIAAADKLDDPDHEEARFRHNLASAIDGIRAAFDRSRTD